MQQNIEKEQYNPFQKYYQTHDVNFVDNNWNILQWSIGPYFTILIENVRLRIPFFILKEISEKI